MIYPFNLPGPEFLGFYACFALAVLGLLFALLRRGEPEGRREQVMDDPFLIAYLRGGKNEAMRVATVSLVDRGLLEIVDENNLRATGAGAGLARRPIEKALLAHYKAAASPAIEAFSDAALEKICEPYEARLVEMKMLPDADIKAARRGRRLLAAAILAGVAAVKIGIALSRGRTNIGFLLTMAFFAGAAAFMIDRRLTAVGSALLEDLRSLFGPLKERSLDIRAGGATAELVMLAAVFGIGALPSAIVPAFKKLYPKAASSSGSSCGSTWVSSCGTSSSCGSSSSCGGGGGGCGGCGGD